MDNPGVLASAATDLSPTLGGRNPDPGSGFRETFTEEIKKGIVRAAKDAYEIVQDSHDEKLGFNANTFGHSVYHVGKFQLEKYFAESGGKLTRVEELKTLFRFQGGDYVVGFYKVGNLFESIWESFPTSDNGATSANSEGQPVLLGLEDAMLDSVENLRYAIVAHMGNPKDGLCAVYLCIPIRAEQGKIVRWGYAEEIYKRDQGMLGTTSPAPSELPPEIPAMPIVPEEREAEIVVTAK